MACGPRMHSHFYEDRPNGFIMHIPESQRNRCVLRRLAEALVKVVFLFCGLVASQACNEQRRVSARLRFSSAACRHLRPNSYRGVHHEKRRPPLARGPDRLWFRLAAPSRGLVENPGGEAGGPLRPGTRATQRAAIRAPGARLYTDAAALFESEETLDFVEICTRPDSHRELVELAARHRVHVLCQKPAAAVAARPARR